MLCCSVFTFTYLLLIRSSHIYSLLLMCCWSLLSARLFEKYTVQLRGGAAHRTRLQRLHYRLLCLFLSLLVKLVNDRNKHTVIAAIVQDISE